MKLEWAPPTTEGESVVYRATMTMEMREIRANPAQFKAGVGDVHQGVRVVRDANIPLGEIHVIEGNRRMVMKYKA